MLLANSTQVIAQAKWLHTALFDLEHKLFNEDRQAVREFIVQASQRRAAWRMAADTPTQPRDTD